MAKEYTDDELRSIRDRIDDRLGESKGPKISPEDAALLDRAGELSDIDLEKLMKRVGGR